MIPPIVASACVASACTRLGWEIIGQPRRHPEGIVYLCRDSAGITEPYTENAILNELACMQRFFNVALQAAGVPAGLATPVAATLSLAIPTEEA